MTMFDYALIAVCQHEFLEWNDCTRHLDSECFVATCITCSSVSFDCGEDFI
jgi:hypothetical protein